MPDILPAGPGISYGTSSNANGNNGNGGNPDGYGRMAGLLSDYGLIGLDDWLRQMLIDGASEDTIALELERTPQFKKRFFAREEARAWNATHPNSPRHIPSPAEILEYEDAVQHLFREAGVPAGFYDEQEDIQRLMANGKSLRELQADIEEGFVRVAQAPPEIREAFANFFGASGDSALASYFLDSEKALPLLEREVKMAEIAGTGVRFGVGITKDRADRLAGLGNDIRSAEDGFERVNQMGSLYSRTVSEAAEDELTAAGAGVDFAFGLDGGTAKAKLISRHERRAADFGGVGGAAEAKDGLTGLGSADN